MSHSSSFDSGSDELLSLEPGDLDLGDDNSSECPSAAEDEVDEWTSLDLSTMALPNDDGRMDHHNKTKELTGDESPTVALTKEEMMRLYNMRQHVEKIRTEINRKAEKVKQLKAELLHSQECQSLLVEEESFLSKELRKASDYEIGLLHGKKTKVNQEIHDEQTLETDTKLVLLRAETELLEAQAEAGQFLHMEVELERGEEAWKKMKLKEFSHRMKNEEKLISNAKRKESLKKRYISELKEQQEVAKVAMDEIMEDNKEKKTFIQTTLTRYKAEKAKIEEQHRKYLEKRMKAILSLKDNITNSEDTIQAKQLLRKEKQRLQNIQDEEERKNIIEKKGNPEILFVRRKRLQQFEMKLEEYKKRQKERKLEIVARLLKEDRATKNVRHGHVHLPRVLEPERRKRKRKRRKDRPATHDSYEDIGSSNEVAPVTSASNEIEMEHEELLDSDLCDNEDEEFTSIDTNNIKTIIEPDIPGLWVGKSLVSKGGGNKNGDNVSEEKAIEHTCTKAEEKIIHLAMTKLKKSIIVKQVAAGREFKGDAFISKPRVLVFKDFDVGMIYHKKLKLTNVSYTVNYCRIEGISQNFKDFIDITFDPPGSMSAGMTCHMKVTFRPQLNEDMDGEVYMLSQTGPFSIPLKCLTKKCLVTVDKTQVDFGGVYIGEVVSAKVTLSNAGALATRYTITSVHNLPPSDQTDHSDSTCKPALGLQRNNKLDESKYSIISDVLELSKLRTIEGEGIIQASDPQKCKSAGVIFTTICQLPEIQDTGTNTPLTRGYNGNQDTGKSRSQDTMQGKNQDTDQSRSQDTMQAKNQDTDQSRSQDTMQDVSSMNESKTMNAPDDDGDLEIPVLTQPPHIKVSDNHAHGEIPPFSSHSIELIFSPLTVQRHLNNFYVHFSCPSSPPLKLSSCGCGIDFPVYIEEKEINLHICLVERLYQTSLHLHNRTSTALQVTFQIPYDLRPYLEVLPKNGVIQGRSSLTTQLKFKPLPSIMDPPTKTKYHTESDGHWRMYISVAVTGHSQLISFLVLAQLSLRDFLLNPTSLDFETCTIYESAIHPLTLTNTSILSQIYGFINVPPYIDIQPGDGFGKLLPEESLQLNVIFSPNKPKDYEFNLCCKSGLNKDYSVTCKGRGILPSLRLSHNSINFVPTGLVNTSTAIFSVINIKMTRLNSAVIRGVAPPQGLKAFQFIVPDDAPLSISPEVGVVGLGNSVRVQIQFHPKLSDEVISEEAILLATKKSEEEKKEMEAERMKQSDPKKQKNGKQNRNMSPLVSSKASLASGSHGNTGSSECSKEKLKDETPEQGSEIWLEAYRILLCSYSNHCYYYTIPCLVSDNITTNDHTSFSYQIENTLYLEVTCPVVRPSLILMEGQSSTIDFGNVGTGDVGVKMITVLNISGDNLNLYSSLLDPCGPFSLRNALCKLPPGAKHKLLFHFSPNEGGKKYDSLILYNGGQSLLELKLVGIGVHPIVTLSLGSDNHLSMSMGNVMMTDSVTKTFTMTNTSPLMVKFKLNLDSISAKNGQMKTFRVWNYNGQHPFVCVPCEGTLETDEVKEVKVIFSPDHKSQSYSDRIAVEYNGQYSCEVVLTGQAWTNNMCVCVSSPSGGGDATPEEQDNILANTESMIPVVQADDTPLPPEPLLIMFNYHSRTEDEDKEIIISTIKTNQVKKTNGDFIIEPIASSNPFSKCFSFEPQKGSIEAGGSKSISITFTPPKDMACSLVTANTTLILKGNIVQSQHLLLRALITE